jgi:hypothetical protein
MSTFEAFTAVMFQVEVFWTETPCSVVAGYNVSEVHAASIFRVKRSRPTTTLHGVVT